MATIPARAENRVVLTNVSWSTFEALLAETDNRGTRFAYDRGVLEIMSPSSEHEWIKRLLGRLVEVWTLELDVAIRSGGSTTLKNQFKEKGLEPDECYYVAHEAQVRQRDEIDLAVDPPPDVALEVDMTASSLDKLGIYAALGVPEVWLCDGTAVRVYVLRTGGTYDLGPHSPAFPGLPLAQVERFLALRHSMSETALLRAFRDWLRKEIPGVG